MNAAQALGRLLLIALVGGAGYWHGQRSVLPPPCDCGPSLSQAPVTPPPPPVEPAQPAPPPLATSAAPVAGLSQALGCFRDAQPLDLNGHHARSANNTPLRCVAICADRGFAYAGLQYGESCLCGNEYGRYGPASNCDLPCTGNLGLTCGGYLANSVYSTGVAPAAITATGMESDAAGGQDAGAAPPAGR